MLEHRVVDVMPRIPLVTGKVHRAIDVDRELDVHLDERSVVPLIPVVAAPWLVDDLLYREALVRRQHEVPFGAPLTLGDGGGEDELELLARDDEGTPERLRALRNRRSPVENARERIDDALEVRVSVRRCDGGVERLRLLVERVALSLEHAY